MRRHAWHPMRKFECTSIHVMRKRACSNAFLLQARSLAQAHAVMCQRSTLPHAQIYLLTYAQEGMLPLAQAPVRSSAEALMRSHAQACIRLCVQACHARYANMQSSLYAACRNCTMSLHGDAAARARWRRSATDAHPCCPPRPQWTACASLPPADE